MLFPTAVHADGAVHETPKRELTAARLGLGVGWMRHAVPSHRSARVTASPEALTYVPTAVHEVAAVQDSPNNWPARTVGVRLRAVRPPPPPPPPPLAHPPPH